MPEVVNIHEAKTHLSRLLDRVQAGEEIILAKAGKPYARLVPFVQEHRPLGLLSATLTAEARERLSHAVLEETDEATIAAWRGEDSENP